ncbi:hypothetical protein PVAND_001838 [Polypedilum vanderplanki]|uniref:Uncharacterized protein n=1 Tax=Polypedilum vanderplanki TaxID=319348 RepID=A0A9J6BPK1_POLVA|nr:hypothetical protein PVAND_001838 [Polypedilum vanderplanki]
MDKYTRPFMIYNSIKKIKFSTPPNNSSLTSFSQIFGYYVKANHSETFEFFEKMSQQNPLTKVMIQLTDDSEETSSIVLQTAYDKFKMLNVATLHRKIKFASLKFYNPFKNRGEFYTINVTRQSVLTEIKKYQNDRIWNLHRFPLRIYIFDSPMSVKKVTLDKTSKIKFIYTDGELANMLSEKMNFTAIYVLSNDEISHNGYLMENGSFSGGIGAIEKNRADLLMNPRLITDLNTTRATFLQPLSTYSYKFVIK